MKRLVTTVARTFILPAVVTAFALAPYAGAQNLTLEEAVKTAIKRHPEVRAQQATTKAAEHIIDQARSGYFPQLDVRSSAGWERVNSPGTRNRRSRNRTEGKNSVSQFTYRNNATLRQPLFDGLETINQTKAAKAQTKSERLTIHNVQLEIAVRAIEAYVEVFRVQNLINVADANIADHQDIVKRVSRRSQRGAGRGADISQANSRLALALAARERLIGRLREAEANYIEAVGESQFEITETGVDLNLFEEPELADDKMPGTIKAAIDRARRYHPAIRAADENVKEFSSRIEVAKSPYYPRLDLELTADVDENVDGSFGHDHSFGAMGVLRWNLFSGGRDTARKREVVQLHSQAMQERRDIEGEVLQSLRTTWSQWITSEQRSKLLRQQANEVEKVYQSFLDQYGLGARTLLDLLDQRNELFVSRTGVIDEEHRALFKRYEVLARTGTLLETIEVSK